MLRSAPLKKARYDSFDADHDENPPEETDAGKELQRNGSNETDLSKRKGFLLADHRGASNEDLGWCQDAGPTISKLGPRETLRRGNFGMKLEAKWVRTFEHNHRCRL